MSPDRDRVELAEYLRILWKRKWLVILPSILVLASALVALNFITPIYVSSAVLEIRAQDIIEEMTTEVLGERSRSPRTPRDYERQRLREIAQEVTGQPFLKRVGEKLGLDQDPGVLASAESRQGRMPNLSMDELVVRVYTNRLKQKISVDGAGINHFRFFCEDEDPLVAYELVSAVAGEYRDYVSTTGAQQTDRTEDFARRELEEKRAELEVAERAYRDYQRQIQTRNINSGNPVTEGNLSDTRLLIDEATLESATLQNRIRRGMERLPAGLVSSTNLRRRAASPRLERLARELADAERDQVPLMIQGTSGHSDISRIRQDIFTEMRSQVGRAFPDQDQRTQNQIGDIIFDLIVLDSVEARVAEIRRLIRDFTNRMTQTTEEDLTLQRLEGKVSDLRRIVGNLEETLLKSDLRHEATQAALESRVRIIEPPEVPQEPDRPNKLRILLLALMAGPLLGVGAVIMAEYLDTSLRTVEEVEELLSLPVLGTIPKLVPANTRSRRSRRSSRRIGAAGVLVLVVCLGGVAIPTPGGAEAAAAVGVGQRDG